MALSGGGAGEGEEEEEDAVAQEVEMGQRRLKEESLNGKGGRSESVHRDAGCAGSGVEGDGGMVEGKESEGEGGEDDEDAEQDADDEQHPIVEASLMVSEMRQQLSIVNELVVNHARTVGFSVHEFENMSERLRMVCVCEHDLRN